MTTILPDDHRFNSTCTNCGRTHDMAGTMELVGGRPPQPGDIMICIECQHIMIVDKDGIRDPTTAEVVEIAGDRDLVRTQRAIAAAKSARSHRQTGGEETPE
jgi:hypothetical protein